jgi:hypothetical protein
MQVKERMCEFVSIVVSKAGKAFYSKKSVSHEEIIEEHSFTSCGGDKNEIGKI